MARERPSRRGLTDTSATKPRTSPCPEVEDRLDDFFLERSVSAGPFGSRYTRLWEAIRNAACGGKRIRPVLVLEAHRLLGGCEPEAAVEAATAFELLHTAFLLHDDVIDGDTVRRGVPNLVGTLREEAVLRGTPCEDATAWGRSAAILAGDLLIHSAQRLLAAVQVRAEVRDALLEVLDEAVFATAAGELEDVALTLVDAEPALPEVLAMSEWKTARYSFQAPLQAGAILAGASNAELTALGTYGRCAGAAFQLRDDLLGAFGDESQTGKSTTSDLSRAAMTPLLCFALHSPSGPELRTLLAEGTSTRQTERTRQLLHSSGATSFVERSIDALVKDALDALDDGVLPLVLRERLAAVAHRASRRLS